MYSVVNELVDDALILELLSGNQSDKTNKYVAPLHSDNLNAMPPSIVITAEFDSLRDEGEQYAKSLANAEISVKFQRFDGVVQEFFGLAGAVSKTADAVKFAAEGLKEVFELKRKSQTN